MKITAMKSITGHDLPDKNTEKLADLYAPVGANKPVWETVVFILMYSAIGWSLGYLLIIFLATIL